MQQRLMVYKRDCNEYRMERGNILAVDCLFLFGRDIIMKLAKLDYT